jgi:hypothetical protein
LGWWEKGGTPCRGGPFGGAGCAVVPCCGPWGEGGCHWLGGWVVGWLGGWVVGWLGGGSGRRGAVVTWASCLLGRGGQTTWARYLLVPGPLMCEPPQAQARCDLTLGPTMDLWMGRGTQPEGLGPAWTSSWSDPGPAFLSLRLDSTGICLDAWTLHPAVPAPCLALRPMDEGGLGAQAAWGGGVTVAGVGGTRQSLWDPGHCQPERLQVGCLPASGPGPALPEVLHLDSRLGWYCMTGQPEAGPGVAWVRSESC